MLVYQRVHWKLLKEVTTSGLEPTWTPDQFRDKHPPRGSGTDPLKCFFLGSTAGSSSELTVFGHFGSALQPTSLQKSSHSQVEEFVADPSHAMGESGTQQVPVFLVTGRYGK